MFFCPQTKEICSQRKFSTTKSVPQPTYMPALKVASYNIHKAVGIDRKYDPARILRVLVELDADVVVLQEADKRLGKRPAAIPRFLLEQETDYAVAHLARNNVSLGWHGNAVLFKKSLNVKTLEHIELPGLEPRGAVMVAFEHLRIVGTHLGLLRTWRHRQMKAILDHLNGETTQTLIMGDFNEWSTSSGFEPWSDSFSILRPGQSFHTRRPVAELDRMAYGGGITVHDHGVYKNRTARIASDHLPVWATIEAKPTGIV
jgi:endonuclease/exonuclease/phosphatase family metal-dependent hydrolase